MNNNNGAHAAILAVWNEYRECIYHGEADRLAAIFHPAASMFFIRDGGVYNVIRRDESAPLLYCDGSYGCFQPIPAPRGASRAGA